MRIFLSISFALGFCGIGMEQSGSGSGSGTGSGAGMPAGKAMATAQSPSNSESRDSRKAREMAWEGNRLYDENHYEEAEIFYRKALEENQGMTEGVFNLWNTTYQQKRFEEAAARFGEVAAREELPAQTRSAAYYNQGNALFEARDYEKAVSSYKQSLRLQPGNEDTKYNLSMAQTMLKKQQEQQQDQQNQDQQKQDQKDQDQDQKQDQQNQDQKDQGKDQQDQDQQDQQKQDQQPGDQDSESEQKDQQGEPKEMNMSPEELQRILEALEQDEKDVQKKINAQKVKGVKGESEKDW